MSDREQKENATHQGLSMHATPDGVKVTREPEVTSARPRTWSPVQPTITPEHRFASVSMNGEQIARVQKLREAFTYLMDAIEENVHPGRARALVTTHLEEASMWATKAISREADR
jgi:hypothetical protein